jgi:hypothetical protein
MDHRTGQLIMQSGGSIAIADGFRHGEVAGAGEDATRATGAPSVMFGNGRSSGVTGRAASSIRDWLRRGQGRGSEVVREECVRHVYDRGRGQVRRYLETVRSEMSMPSFSNSPGIRGAPHRQFSAAMRQIKSRDDESIRGRPGRPRWRKHRRTPSRYQRSTVAGWTKTSASLHRGHTHRNNSHSKRSIERSAHANARAHRAGGAGRESRAGGLYASPG